MLRRRSQGLTVNHERWLVSYADFVTLLFGFFVVMYSMSQMHETDYQKLSSALEELFSAAPQSNNTSESTDIGLEISKPLTIETFSEPSEQDQLPTAQYDMAQLPVLEDTLKTTFADLINTEKVRVDSNEHWLQLTLNNKVLFPLGSVIPSQQARDIMEEIAIILRQYGNPVQVEGFTDNLPINTPQFPSNWELSTARAAAIVKLLMAEGVNPNTLAAVGYGEFHPIADNGSAAGRAKNRRVVLMIGREPRPRPSENHKALPNHSSSEQSEIQGLTPIPPSVNAAPAGSAAADIAPITLESGDLLFTSDPEKIRAAQQSSRQLPEATAP